jgi:hypothetical protein
MEKDKKEQNEEDDHGIISVVQSPDEEAPKTEKNTKSDEEDKHGIISIVQSPDEKKQKKRIGKK